MNDDQVCIAVLRPMADNPFLEAWYVLNRADVDAGRSVDATELHRIGEMPMLSSGERALIEIALAFRNWKPVNMITTLGAMNHRWQHHVLAMLATRLGLHAGNSSDELGWIETYDVLA